MLFRTAIRELTVRMLANLEGDGPIGSRVPLFRNVFNARETVIVREQLPCAKVWTPREGGNNLSIGVPEIRSTCDLIVQIVIEGPHDETNARAIDWFCERVHLELVESAIWQTSMERLLSLNTDTETNTEGEVRTVTATMTFEMQYNYLYITRILDHLRTLDINVVTPDQPPGPAGEPGEANTRVVIELQP